MAVKIKKIFLSTLCLLLLFQQAGFAQVAAELNIAGHLSSLHSSFVSNAFRPIHLRYLSFNPLDNSFKLFLDKGDFLKGLSPQGTDPEDSLKEETAKLMQYFLIGLTLPNDTFWVNLRPDSPDQIIDDRLAQTDIGKIMLETDLQLKKDTSSFTSPQTSEGKEYWDKLYKKAEELYGTDTVTIPTLTRPWIVPGEIIIRETTDSAYIYKATLKVMLEQDYLRDGSQNKAKLSPGVYEFKDQRSKALNEYSTQLIKEFIIPKLTKKINSSKEYASLRQVYYSLIMAQWFKARFKGKQGPHYNRIDSQNLTNLTSQEDWSKNTYFQAYKKSFADGEYNIQEPVYTPTGQVIRSYMSGGIKAVINIGDAGEKKVSSSVATSVESILGFRQPLINPGRDIAVRVETDGNQKVRLTGTNQSISASPITTFMEYCTTDIGINFNELSENDLLGIWPLYLTEVNRFFAEAGDYYSAYSKFYDMYAKHKKNTYINPAYERPYTPLVMNPFSGLKEIKNLINTQYEYSIEFFPPPGKWKGASAYNFIICLLNDGQLHMSFYDGNGILKQFNSDVETEAALKAMGVIGGEGFIVVIRSSENEKLRHNALPGIAGRISMRGHSHPKESGIIPSKSNDWDSPSDIELFDLGLFGFPKDFPVNTDIPFLTHHSDANSSIGEIEPVQSDLLGALEGYADKLEWSTGVTDDMFPLRELRLYLKVLAAMYKTTIQKYESSTGANRFVHLRRAEFAGELAHHPRFLNEAFRMLNKTHEGAFQILAQQHRGNWDEFSSLEEMKEVITQIIDEVLRHSNLRNIALILINDPKTYGLDEADFIKSIGDYRNREEDGQEGHDERESPGDLTNIDQIQRELPIISDGLFNSAKEEVNEDGLKPSLSQVVKQRANYLLALADSSVNDDPQLAFAAVKEYLRLLKKFGAKVNFGNGITAVRYQNLMASQTIRPLLFEIAGATSGEDNQCGVLSRIALQLIKEANIQEALNLLEKIEDPSFNIFFVVLTEAIGNFLASKEYDNKTATQLERVVESIPPSESYDEEPKVQLMVTLGNRYYELGLKEKSAVFYKKAWEASQLAKEPALIQLKYIVPVIREKGIEFPSTRDEILDRARIIVESDFPHSMILLAREYAFNRDYDKAEQCALFIKNHTSFQRDYNSSHGAIIEAAALYGDNDRIDDVASKMTDDVIIHFEHAAIRLIDRGEYERAIELVRGAIKGEYEGSRYGGNWGSVQLRIAKLILEKDATKINMAKDCLVEAVKSGITNYDLQSILELFSQYPELDPDGALLLDIFDTVFEKNHAVFEHKVYRIILQNLREIILAKVKKVNPSLLKMTDVFRQTNKLLTSSDDLSSVADSSVQAKPPGTNSSVISFVDPVPEGSASSAVETEKDMNAMLNRWIKEKKGSYVIRADDGEELEINYFEMGPREEYEYRYRTNYCLEIGHKGERIGFIHFFIDEMKETKEKGAFTWSSFKGYNLINGQTITKGVFVDPAYRDRHIGDTLMGIAMRIARLQGAKFFGLMEVYNESYFTRLGFDYPPDPDADYMEFPLEDSLMNEKGLKLPEIRIKAVGQNGEEDALGASSPLGNNAFNSGSVVREKLKKMLKGIVENLKDSTHDLGSAVDIIVILKALGDDQALRTELGRQIAGIRPEELLQEGIINSYVTPKLYDGDEKLFLFVDKEGEVLGRLLMILTPRIGYLEDLGVIEEKQSKAGGENPKIGSFLMNVFFRQLRQYEQEHPGRSLVADIKAEKNMSNPERNSVNFYRRYLENLGIKEPDFGALGIRITLTDPSGEFDLVRIPVKAVIERITAQTSSPVGGIDFRSLPIVAQAMTNLSANILSTTINRLKSINLDEEWSSIERMVSSSIKPSAERVREYVQASSALGKIIQDRDKIILCISDMLRSEEEECCETDPVLRDILVVLESIQRPQQLKEVFLGTTT